MAFNQFIHKNQDIMLTLLIALFTLASSSFLLFHIAAEGITIVISIAVFLHFFNIQSEKNGRFTAGKGWVRRPFTIIGFTNSN